MPDRLLFGDKSVFAIEVRESKYSTKFFLRLWIQDFPMGAFKKAADLKMSIDTFRKILDKKETMYLPVFDGMTATEIHHYTKMEHDIDDDMNRLESLVPLYKISFFGKHFTDTQSEHLLVYKDNELLFIWKNDFKDPLYEALLTSFAESLTSILSIALKISG